MPMSRQTRNWVNIETVFLLLVIISAGWMLIQSFDFTQSGSGLYPQLTAGSVLSLVGILLFWQFLLPDKIRERLTSSEEAISYGEISREDGDDQIDERAVIQMLLVFMSFVILAYFLGFLVAAAIYVYVTQVQFGYKPRKRRIGVTLLVVGLLYLGYLVLGIDLLYGELYSILLGV